MKKVAVVGFVLIEELTWFG